MVQYNILFTDLETTKAPLQARYEDALKLITAGHDRACHFLYRNMDDDKLGRAMSTNVIAAERRPRLARPRQHDVLHTAVNRPAGVFFSADVSRETGLPRSSAEQYGSNRLLLKTDRLLTKSINLYFVNYTKAAKATGYVTLLAVDRSKAVSELKRLAQDMITHFQRNRFLMTSQKTNGHKTDPALSADKVLPPTHTQNIRYDVTTELFWCDSIPSTPSTSADWKQSWQSKQDIETKLFGENVEIASMLSSHVNKASNYYDVSEEKFNICTAEEFAEARFLLLENSRQSPSTAAEENETIQSHPNPFLYYDTAKKIWHVTTDLNVEVFYAHDVPIDDVSLNRMNACLYKCADNHNHGTVLRPSYVRRSLIDVEVDRWHINHLVHSHRRGGSGDQPL